MTRRTFILTSVAMFLGAMGVLVGLHSAGASNELLAFVYAVLLCGVSVGFSQLALRYDSKRRR